MLRAKMEDDTAGVDGMRRERVLGDNGALVLNLDVEVDARRQHAAFAGYVEHLNHLARGQAVVDVGTEPHLKQAALGMPKRAATVDECPLDMADFGDMERCGNMVPAGQLHPKW